MDSAPSPAASSPPRRPDRRLRRRAAATSADGNDDAPNLTAVIVDQIENPDLPSSPKPAIASHPQPQGDIPDGTSLEEALVISPPLLRPPMLRPRRRAQVDAAEADAETETPPRARRRRKPRQSADGADGAADVTATSKIRRRSVNPERVKKVVPDADVGKGRKRMRRNEVSVLEEEDARQQPEVLLSCSNPTTEPCSNGSRSCTEGVWDLVYEVVMWKDVAKSGFWFGIGSTCFLSSCFSSNFKFNVIPALSNMGLIALALAFFRNAIFKSNRCTRKRFKLKEEDLTRTIRSVLPVANTVVSMAQDLFSGEPGMTLKVAPILLVSAEYGHLVTPWRFSAIGFFISFAVPKLYTCFSHEILRHVDSLRQRISEVWKASRHKKTIAFVGAMMSWNIFSAKTCIFSAFMLLVMLCYHYQWHKKVSESSETKISTQEQWLAPEVGSRIARQRT